MVLGPQKTKKIFDTDFLFSEYLKCSDPEMKQTLLDLADAIISSRKAPTPLNQIQQILQHYARSEFTDLETLKVVTRLNDLCSRLVAPFHPAKIVEFIKIEDGLLESSVIESNTIDRNRFPKIIYWPARNSRPKGFYDSWLMD